jgi:hypothetical protein
MMFLGWRSHEPSAIMIEHGLELNRELGRDKSCDVLLLPSHFLIELQLRYS